jgi:HK97 family phage portal protein
MTIIDRAIRSIAARLGYIKADEAQQLPSWASLYGDAYEHVYPDPGQERGQYGYYSGSAAVWSAVNAVARTAATTAFAVKRRKPGEELVDIPSHPFELLLQRPNPYHSRYRLLEATFAYLAITGNAYWFLNRTDAESEPDEMWIIPPHNMAPVPGGDTSMVQGYVFENDYAQRITLETWEVAHFSTFNPYDYYRGLSPLMPLAVDVQADMSQQQWQRRHYSLDNGKLPGILAFADRVSDAEWEGIKYDIKKHSKEDRMMLLRNAGTGGVQWLPITVEQQKKQFLETRQFTKEDIYAVLAPGLASMLAVNATEANANAGRATFLDLAVHPLLVLVAEEITNHILPSYNNRARSDLVGMFEDIRNHDQALELQQIAAYERTHTVNETRQRWWQSPPLGTEEHPDHRGALLVSDRLAQTRQALGEMQDRLETMMTNGNGVH